MGNTRLNNRPYSPTSNVSMINSYDVSALAPHDTRLVIDKKEDLIKPATWVSYLSNGKTITTTPAVYTGLVTYTVDEALLYILNNLLFYFRFASDDDGTYFISSNNTNYANIKSLSAENSLGGSEYPNPNGGYIFYINKDVTASGYKSQYSLSDDTYAFLTTNATKVEKGVGWMSVKSDDSTDLLFTTNNNVSSITSSPHVINVASLGATGSGVGTTSLFDESNKIKSDYLPSYVDDVIDVEVSTYGTNSITSFKKSGTSYGVTGETGKLYVVTTDYKVGTTIKVKAGSVYRWSGSAYVQISGGNDSDTRITNIESQLTWKSIIDLATTKAIKGLNNKYVKISDYIKENGLCIANSSNQSGYNISESLANALTKAGGSYLSDSNYTGVPITQLGYTTTLPDTLVANILFTDYGNNKFIIIGISNKSLIDRCDVWAIDIDNQRCTSINSSVTMSSLFESYSGTIQYITDDDPNIIS